MMYKYLIVSNLYNWNFAIKVCSYFNVSDLNVCFLLLLFFEKKKKRKTSYLTIKILKKKNFSAFNPHLLFIRKCSHWFRFSRRIWQFFFPHFAFVFYSFFSRISRCSALKWNGHSLSMCHTLNVNWRWFMFISSNVFLLILTLSDTSFVVCCCRFFRSFSKEICLIRQHYIRYKRFVVHCENLNFYNTIHRRDDYKQTVAQKLNVKTHFFSLVYFGIVPLNVNSSTD